MAYAEDAGTEQRSDQGKESGWALLGLLLALAVIAIGLVELVPSVEFQMRREKEAEMIYRGEQMAQAIARYYNRGALGAIQLNVPPPYGYLFDLNKLKDGITIGIQEFRLVRPSAMIDPLSNTEWAPVRVRDPRLSNAMQAYAAYHKVPIPPQYLLLAAPPTRLHLASPLTPITPEPTVPAPGTPTGQPGGQVVQRPAEEPDDEEEDEDEDEEDPLSHLLEGGNSNLPIIGVAPRVKGAAVRPLYGMKSYEEWVFIFIPQPQFRPGIPLNPNLPPGTPQPRLQ